MNNNDLLKEIDLIQNCIERMSNRSFMLKGWFLTLYVGIFAILKNEVLNNIFLLLSSVLILCFWILDAFFLRTEREFRALYKWVIVSRKLGRMDYQFDLNPERFANEVECWLRTMFSCTLLVFYGIPILVVIILSTYNILITFLCSCPLP